MSDPNQFTEEISTELMPIFEINATDTGISMEKLQIAFEIWTEAVAEMTEKMIFGMAKAGFTPEEMTALLMSIAGTTVEVAEEAVEKMKDYETE